MSVPIACISVAEKQQQFNAALTQYRSRPGYTWFGYGVSSANVGLQGWLLWQLRGVAIGWGGQLLALGAAWLLADFINGLVHLYMDDNDRYDTVAGPLIANFHLHHKQPVYTPRSLPLVYFIESGSKLWLVPCLALLAVLSSWGVLNPVLLTTLVYFGVLSSVAEVSHYLCHTSVSPLAIRLGNCGILLAKRRHGIHHTRDNVGYAFLNGISDPLINSIAARLSRGYKHHTDLHYATCQLDGDSR